MKTYLFVNSYLKVLIALQCTVLYTVCYMSAAYHFGML